jgi:CheY-like chemotaxis protein
MLRKTIRTLSSKPSVLVVEDEGLVALHLKECLSDLGLSADVFTEGRPALQALSSTTYAAAVLDLGLPDISGGEIVKALLDRDPTFRIVLTTGHDVHEVERRFGSAPRVRVLGKPYDASMLEDELARLGIVHAIERPPVRMFDTDFTEALMIA